ncbi:MAG: hypothetical protein ACRDKZ_03585, partial [Actinomycetota bacterium]
YVVYATTTPGVRPSEGTSSFVVPRGAPGFAIGKVYEKVGGRLFNNAELVFDDCRLPLESLLIKDTAAGSSGRHFRPFSRHAARTRAPLPRVSAQTTFTV